MRRKQRDMCLFCIHPAEKVGQMRFIQAGKVPFMYLIRYTIRPESVNYKMKSHPETLSNSPGQRPGLNGSSRSNFHPSSLQAKTALVDHSL